MSGQNEKYYRVKTKDGAHINEKVNEDGYRAALQFDDENTLQGPVEVIEVDEDELYEEYGYHERGLKQVMVEDVVAPALEQAVEAAASAIAEVVVEAAAKAVGFVVKDILIPAAKKGTTFAVNKVKEVHAENKAKKQQKKETGLATTKAATILEKNREADSEEAVYHTQDEVDQIQDYMRKAAMVLAAGIRELSKTIVVDADDPEKCIANKKEFEKLATKETDMLIQYMLEDKNKDLLDEASRRLFYEFQQHNIIVDDRVIPINRYIDIE